ncbi:uncharacterized protein BXZ73DRAFT_81157 [Epithele typhae]|uniref:uncharacterized protein n=1 Tax=Epithele typhae TaxID=378194 RepID=UPI002008BF8A|nr:uncharacterized protein BXZ73DRAFT_81157 [Epithele typhae]KAH9916301.1 hypothetical protein BXZ73DRAFT_81157 [Epithele typhae]
MPHLRVLALKFFPLQGKGLARPADDDSVIRSSRETERPPLWPPGYTGPFPWPELERLVVSCQTWTTKSTITSLQRFHLWWFVRGRPACYEPPDLRAYHTATLTLGILRRCAIPDLDQLTIEYVADEGEDQLLAFLGQAFPRLSTLSVLQYARIPYTHFSLLPRLNGELPARRIASGLANLVNLRRLKIYFDFYRYLSDTQTIFEREIVRPQINILAQTLSPSVSSISGLVIGLGSEWMWQTYETRDRQVLRRVPVRGLDGFYDFKF